VADHWSAMKILIVEDNPNDRLLLAATLRGAGFVHLLFAATAEEVFRLLGLEDAGGEEGIGVVLLDLSLAESGLDACRRIKADPRLQDVMVIMATLGKEPEVMQAAFAAGAMDFVVKPWEPVELLTRLRSAVSLAETQHRLRASENRLRVIIASLGDGLLVLDKEGCITFVNPAAERLLGWSEAELRGVFIGDRARCSERAPEFGVCPLMRPVLSGEVYRGEDLLLQRSDASWFAVGAVSSPLRGRDGVNGAVVTFHAIVERKRAEDPLRHLGGHEAPTGLSIRPAQMERLADELVRARRIQSRVGLLFIDLDRFKPFNEQFGHVVGDAVLDIMEKRMMSAVRDVDYVARLRGDEFIAVLVDADHPYVFGQVARKLLGLIEQPFEVGGSQHRLSASIGIAAFPQDAQTAHELLDAAVAAMHEARNAGRGRFATPCRSGVHPTRPARSPVLAPIAPGRAASPG
jgi:diguanylate cyclase (GGDEF)-like protein/PAS domain S-box-containing protein